MSQQAEPMDIDNSVCDFDNKENSLHNSNVYSRTPCTEKGYEELEVTELSMKLRYSITPTASPMSKSFTANCLDNQNQEACENSIVKENCHLTKSLNLNLSKNDKIPLQALPTDQFIDANRNPLMPLDSTREVDNITVSINGPGEHDTLSLPSSSSSIAHTPEATTPTKEIKDDNGSPIIRGLKSVLNMFRPSQSPIPPAEEDNLKPEVLSPPVVLSPDAGDTKPQVMLASTPLAAQKTKDALCKSNSPNRDSIVFNDDLETELQWKDETTILFSQEKIPIHKLFFPNVQSDCGFTPINLANKMKEENDKLDATVEYMDISYNGSVVETKQNETQTLAAQNDMSVAAESDSEFVDCETTFVKEDSKMPVKLKSLEEENHNYVTDTITPDVTDILNRTMTTIENIESTTENTLQEDIENLKDIEEKNKLAIDLENPQNNLPISDLKPDDSLGHESNKVESSLLINKDLDEDELRKLEIKDQINAPLCKESFDKTSIKESTMQDSSIFLLQTEENDFQSTNGTEGKQVSDLEKEAHIVDKDIVNPDFEPNTAVVNELSRDVLSVTLSNNLVVEKIDGSNNDSIIRNNFCVNTTTPDLVNAVTIASQNSSSSDPPLQMPSPDLGVSNLSKIPLLADPRVLLFNIQPQTVTGDVKPHDIDVLNMSPADIPLPDDDDVEKVSSVSPSVEGNNLSCNNKDVSLNEVTNETHIHAFCAEKTSITHETSHDVVNLPSDAIETCKKIEPYTIDVANNELDQDVITISSIPSTKLDVTESELLNPPESVCDIPNKSLPDLVQPEEVINQFNTNNEAIATSSIPEVLVATPPDAIEKPKLKQLDEKVNLFLKENNVVDKSFECITEKDEVTCDTDPTIENIPHKFSNIDDKIVLKISDHISPDQKNANDIDTERISVENTVSVDDKDKKFNEEILTSENNSPFVSVSVDDISDENPIHPFEDKKLIENSGENSFESNTTLVVTPPGSPKIVSRGAYNFNFDEIEDPFATKTKIRTSSSPASTPNKEIINTGNGDTNNVSSKINIHKNRQNTMQPHMKKSVPCNKKLNATVIGATSSDKNKIQKSQIVQSTVKNEKNNDLEVALDEKASDKLITETNDITSPIVTNNSKTSYLPEVPESITKIPCEITDANNRVNEDNIEESQKIVKDNLNNTTFSEILKSNLTFDKDIISSVSNDEVDTPVQSMEIVNDPKTSSSEQSVYFSTGTSNEGLETKSVFNLPEIDDMNFNSFATKSKVRQLPPNLCSDESFVLKTIQNESNIVAPRVEGTKGNNDTNNLNETSVLNKDSSDKFTVEFKDTEKDESDNMNNTGSSTGNDDKDVTARTINTEDEDTIEGPFLEPDDQDTHKISEFDSGNMDIPQFNELPTHGNDDAGELFIDAEAFEFLLNQNANTVADSGKESLFLKFDPLFAKRMSSEGAIAALRELHKKQSTPKKTISAPSNETLVTESPITSLDATRTLDVANESNDELNITIAKPMMVVNPAVIPSVTPRNKTMTPARLNRQSLTFTSPAIAVIDRLLSMSANSSLMDLDNTVTEVHREPSEADQALTQLRELLADKEISVYNLRIENKELKERLTILESQMRALEKVNEERLKKINELDDKLNEKTKVNKSMAAVVEEYERTIASLISETEQDKKRHAAERLQLMRERDEQTNHLASMEISFNDLHSKYEKSKQVIFGFKANEEVYTKSIKEFQENFAKMQKNYELLKQHATSKLNHANEELQKMNRAHEAEVLKLNAMIKRKELHITSLEETLSQKTKANEELTKICDELLYKV